ncbi:hypothetical protein Pmani_014377 [Petrolisthes manimaculis]|uniref:Uncharacterized protein n=1 Tax=Petrolisthes manimaculis TaxID=1843537 RepID=A0AAE1UCQ2_9EUCA|nr:hypothetical protein Pmani_014377 [Petrolisthes manimaculis]
MCDGGWAGVWLRSPFSPSAFPPLPRTQSSCGMEGRIEETGTMLSGPPAVRIERKPEQYRGKRRNLRGSRGSEMDEGLWNSNPPESHSQLWQRIKETRRR